MAKTSILDYSATPAENQDVNGTSILGTARPSNMDDAIRTIMSHLADGGVSRRDAKDTAYTAVRTDHNQIIDFTEAATLTTASAATLTDGWMCYIYASGGDVTINPNGSETVNGEETAVVKEGGMGVLRVYDGNFLLNYFVGGGASSEILHEESETSLSSSSSRDITGIASDFRAFEIEGEMTGLTANTGVASFVFSVGDGATWTDSLTLVTWTNSGTGPRRFIATVNNLDDEDLSIFYQSNTDNSPDNFRNWVTPEEYATRPITAIRFRIIPPTGVTTLSIGKLRVRGIRT